MRNSPPAHIVVGLGNPGRHFRRNRHNLGFMVLDRLSERLGVKFSRLQSKALVAKTTCNGSPLILAKPQTYMNLSGLPVSQLIRFYKTPLDHLLVVYDDVDLPFSVLRLRPGGGAAGHKGMLSIIEKIGSQEFPRLRIGIDRPPGRMEASDYVLQNFSPSEAELLDPLLTRAAESILTYLNDGLEAAMNRYNPTE